MRLATTRGQQLAGFSLGVEGCDFHHGWKEQQTLGLTRKEEKEEEEDLLV